MTKLANQCLTKLDTAMIFTQEIASYYVEARIAEEKCRSGKNLHWCSEAARLRKKHGVAEQNYADSIRWLKNYCSVHISLEDWEE